MKKKNVDCISTTWIPFCRNIPLGGNNHFTAWYWEMVVFAWTDIAHFRLRGDTIFLIMDKGKV